ncbi:c-type cytochrome biogenesis protein CcmI [Neiella marina]|uniref:C-type cytochrome biogenesis protein CcmI n=1 Tax=Neiella holothuriorum TaxID=2870530 RepID=A0ABS7EET2_9GAMM|nr:c-type cytochrome biogenesis protein CcmI [Neiella holothuriorum]MBW8190770.1 c-type cytochrome biogenesis protein CcmI [Neiella holothuriorum]
MMLFWVGAVILLLIVLVPFVMIAKRPKVTEGISQLELNKQVFEQRQQELAEQLAAGTLTKDEHAQLSLELQTNLLDDTEDMAVEQRQDGSMAPLWAMTAVGLVAAIALYVSMGHFQKVDQWQQSMVEMPELAQRLMQPGDNPLSNEELEQFALALRTKLQQNGDDAMGWLLFGRIQLSFGRLNEATEAFTHALRLEPDNRSVNLSYAKAMAMTGEPAKINYAKRVYQRLLATAPNDLDILSEQAFTLYETGDRKGAFASWQKMLEIIPEDNPRHQQIAQTIAMLQSQQHASNPHAQQRAAAEPQPEAAPQPQVAASDANTPEAEALSIQVTIDAAASVNVPDTSFLVVYARAVQGPPMPMAVKRMALPSFPLTVELSSADAMMENYQLGAVEPFEVVVKIVASANVATADSLYEAVSRNLSKQDLPTQINLSLQAQ